MYIMQRTQLYLDEDLYRALVTAATRQGSTLSQVLRERLRKALESEPPVNALEALDQAVGAWGERPDLPDTETYLRRLRRESRRHDRARPQDRRR